MGLITRDFKVQLHYAMQLRVSIIVCFGVSASIEALFVLGVMRDGCSAEVLSIDYPLW